jgi:membrane-associated phospholipid phosphatase
VLALADPLVELDHLILQSVEGLRWAPATALFVLASAWWVKGPLFVLLAGVGDARARRTIPLSTGLAALSLALACVVSAVLKDAFDRARPEAADPSLVPAIATPSNASFPSGHAMTAFATAVVVGALHPRLRWPALAVATLVALSRVYLGVHFALDVLAGAAIGTGIALLVVRTARLLASRRRLALS